MTPREKLTNLEKIELQCRKLLSAKTSEERSDILKDSIGYLGLAKAYVEMCDRYFAERIKNSNDFMGD